MLNDLEQEKTLENFKKQNLDTALKDLTLDRQKPWEGLGRDPRGDQWEDDDMEEDDMEEDEEDDDNDRDPGMRRLLICSALMTYASAVRDDAHFLDMLKARRVGDERIKWPKPN